uniref:Calcium influx-promoting protein ehs1 n=1 Tax=Ganoderma boninense TaxID=34458 RepID=A0A5K1K464_9APHY|nr:Calcium influx-promoting protein ehs1 [Ganoderma boninense]
MASLLAGATKTAHHLATSLLSAAEVKVGSTIPIKVPVKEDATDKTLTFESIKGKNVFVGVPGAFTGTCSEQVPQYIKAYEEFRQRGVDNIYIVMVNDAFVAKAWKEQLGPNSPVHFIADDQGAFTGALGMLFDASNLLGAPRSKRYVLVTENDVITHLAVEPDPGHITVTRAENILPWL